MLYQLSYFRVFLKCDAKVLAFFETSKFLKGFFVKKSNFFYPAFLLILECIVNQYILFLHVLWAIFLKVTTSPFFRKIRCSDMEFRLIYFFLQLCKISLFAIFIILLFCIVQILVKVVLLQHCGILLLLLHFRLFPRRLLHRQCRIYRVL